MTTTKSAVTVALACIIGALMWLTGCGAGFFSAKTIASYTISPDGKTITYQSTKEQQGLDLDLQEKDGKVTGVKIHVDRASTAEQAIAASQAVTLKLAEVLQQLIPLLEKAAASGS